MFLPKRHSTVAELKLLQKENDGLRTEIIKLRHELTNKRGYAERLEVLLRERMERIDELTATIREQTKILCAAQDSNVCRPSHRTQQIVSAFLYWCVVQPAPSNYRPPKDGAASFLCMRLSSVVGKAGPRSGERAQRAACVPHLLITEG
jgi:hypothetical protein